MIRSGSQDWPSIVSLIYRGGGACTVSMLRQVLTNASAPPRAPVAQIAGLRTRKYAPIGPARARGQ